MTDKARRSEAQEGTANASGTRRPGMTGRQWTILIVMAGALVAIGGALLWVLRAGLLGEPVDVLATVVAGPTPTATRPALVPDAMPTPSDLYWPAAPQPLATPNAPSDLLWWDARFAYRRRIEFDAVSATLPAGTWARVLFDGEQAQGEGKMRVDGADLRVLVWDGTNWWELPRSAAPRREKRGWNVLFPLQHTAITQYGHYYLYYGNPYAASPPTAPGAPASSRLLLSLGEEEGVEWGPEVAWTGNGATAQRLVSPDGRVVIESPPGGPARDMLVRLRTVPMGEGSRTEYLPDYELHAEPPPVSLSESNVARWDPPLTVTINWTGLPVSPDELEKWTHFVHDTDTGSWYSISVEFDRERGLTRMVTDQP